MIWQERTVGIEQVPHRPDWLSAGERDALRATHDNRGSVGARLVAKQLLAESIPSAGHYSQVHIESRDGRDRPTRPQVYLRGRLIPWSVSLSHSARTVSAAVLPAHQGSVGIDLVDLTSISTHTLKYWLTSAEARRATDELSAGLIWSLKEAVYKATNQGTPFYPRRIDTAMLLPLAQWSRTEDELRRNASAGASLANGWELSLHVAAGTLKALVWCPATRCLARLPA